MLSHPFVLPAMIVRLALTPIKSVLYGGGFLQPVKCVSIVGSTYYMRYRIDTFHLSMASTTFHLPPIVETWPLHPYLPTSENRIDTSLRLCPRLEPK